MQLINETDEKLLIVIPFPVRFRFAEFLFTLHLAEALASFNQMKNVTTKVYKSSLFLDSLSLGVLLDGKNNLGKA